MAGTLDRAVEALRSRQRALWVGGLLTYGVTDLATTVVGLSLGLGSEAGPLASVAVARWGLPGLVALKLLTLLAFYLLWRVVRTPGRVAVPLALLTVGVAVTLSNLAVLLW
jgi:hypothetical protein